MSMTDVVLDAFADLVSRHLEPLNAEHRAREQVRDAVLGIVVEGGPAMALQPIFDIASMKVAGYEALARFPGPRDWTPDRWFQQAEQVGLGTALEAAAVHAALQHLPGLPPGTSLAINVSAEALLASPTIKTMVGDAGREAQLVLELTEQHSITEPEELFEVLTVLRTAGVRIAVDDAGSGYSGLERIVFIAPDVLKLDRNLVGGVADHRGQQAMCEAMVGFAHRTSALLIAEGVETYADLRTLRALGVTHAQGYLLGRPSQPHPFPQQVKRPHTALPESGKASNSDETA
jgi:EAL domain-containing protein (putative c-di-GMP-specific phosphodiesterase class I)